MTRFPLALAVSTLIALLAGCGGGGNTLDAPGAATQAAAHHPDASGADEGSDKRSTTDAVVAKTNAVAPLAIERALADAVSQALVAARGDAVRASYGSLPAPVIELQRRSADGRWAFGGGYFPLPASAHDTSPVALLFIAQRSADGWSVALEDSAHFNDFAQAAPDAVMSTHERALFQRRADHQRLRQSVQRGEALSGDTGLSMPFQYMGAVWGTAGVHGDSGTSRPYNAIDFWGGDGQVRASRDGIAYKFCTNAPWPYIKIVHDNGWSTGYYHTRYQAAIANGQFVHEGDYIGQTGVELPCGGHANGAHVHWTLWRSDSGAAEAVNGKTIGGWTWWEGASAYSGFAERNGMRVYANQSGLVNYGHGTGAPCSGTGCKTYTGSFTASGQIGFLPTSGGFYYAGGTLRGWLQGAAGTDYDLILGRYNASTGQWDRVAGSDGPTSSESLSYSAPAGYYRWRINDYSGSGGFTLWTQQ